ncbi:MAG: hypothetical protein LBS33_08000 [Streptococcaceae bacterium]|jgi:hypothetical protein|nr:hypothetical protein [Streptococcaceae bacterium]
MNENNKIDLDNLILDSNNLKNAIQALDTLVFDHFSSLKITVKDLNALSGLTSAFCTLSERNNKNIEVLENDRY